MNTGQMAQQLKHLLEQVRWGAAEADLVFGSRGSVAVFAGVPEHLPAGAPWCLVGIESAEVDEDEPGLLTQQFGLLVGAEVAGDRMGENALIGGAAASLGRSANRGVAEVAERARFAVQKLTGADGAKIQVSSVTAGPAGIGDRGRHVATMQIGLEAVCTSAPHYLAPQHMRYESGKWRWYGLHCEARFDWVRYRVVRKSGQDPSADPSDGTVVYTGTAAEWTGSRVNGQTYTVFADYNSRGSGGGGVIVEGSSWPDVGSYRTA